jgi:hypothetical protein
MSHVPSCLLTGECTATRKGVAWSKDVGRWMGGYIDNILTPHAKLKYGIQFFFFGHS